MSTRATFFITLVIGATLSGCGDYQVIEGGTTTDNSSSSTDSGDAPEVVDADDDGFTADIDCDDTDASIGEGSIWFRDLDGDGYGDSTMPETACEQPSGYVIDATDCNDQQATVHPGATEYCDSVDNDCNDIVDDPALSWYVDNDRDGYGNPNAEVIDGCDPDDDLNVIPDNTDCDDTNASVNPGMTEVCDPDNIDEDCVNGADDDDSGVDSSTFSTWYTDADTDGFGDASSSFTQCEQPEGTVTDATDCDDTDSDVHPSADEVCNGQDDDCDGTVDNTDAIDAVTWYTDADSDGYGDPDAATTTACELPTGFADNVEDCDDTDSAISPDANEVCDDVDNNCDGETDEPTAVDALSYYPDLDGDGYGNASGTVQISCDAISGHVLDATDCNDDADDVNPGMTEVCDELDTDEDCSGTSDDDDSGATGQGTYYHDGDGDSYGDASDSVTVCDPDADYIADSSDCDDTDSDVHPSADEMCDGEDNDCDGTVDNTDAIDAATWYIDADSDGHGDSSTSTTACSQPSGYADNTDDCDDTDSAISPDANEVCDDVDNDCDGITDEDDAADALSYYPDLDGDGYGNASGTVQISCDAISGHVLDDTDCDDGNADTYPGAMETCDSIDNDCDGDIDDDDGDVTGQSEWYADADTDTFGDASSSTIACFQPTGHVSDSSDCDDTRSDINPDATEVCDADDTDEDCNGSADDADSGVTGQSTWYTDNDGDGYGDAAVLACDQPSGTVTDDSDCDDTNSTIYPGAEEVCDSVDNDCDGDIDSGATDTQTFYLDADGDGYGDPSSSMESCTQPSGYVSDATDCDDTDASVYPGATEYCDSIDNDCDTIVDENDAADAATWYADGDADSYGDPSSSMESCTQPSGYVSDATDCDDTRSDVNTAATEYCDSIDNDCDGDVDEDDAADAATWYHDADADGYGDYSSTKESCTQPTGYVSDDTDCDGTESSIYPGAIEVCDDVDNDCDGEIDEPSAADALTWYYDADLDGYGDPDAAPVTACEQPSGYVTDDTDCNDASAAVNPGMTEVCDESNTDEDCNGSADDDDSGVDTSSFGTWYNDADTDGFGDASSSHTKCEQPVGTVEDDTDCDDTRSDINPGADEVCDSIDNDCDSVVDNDDAIDATTWYADSDADGYGDPSSDSTACAQPTGYVSNATDCDDTDASVSPGADEYCNSTDDNCDGTVDEGSAIDASTWNIDIDGDGYGDNGDYVYECSQPSGYVLDDPTNLDCDDADGDIHPGATEVCDGEDNDCDGDTDDADSSITGQSTWYDDGDADGFGDASDSTLACEQPVSYVSDDTDCNDSRSDIYPDADEYCDGVDTDCDGITDEDDALDALTWYADADTDTYGDSSSTTNACSQPTGYVGDDTDCDDTNSTINPGASESCNGVDDNCDGDVDEGVLNTYYSDADGDGYGDNSETGYDACSPSISSHITDNSDCDDLDATIHPDGVETCDGVDENCNGTADDNASELWYIDGDGDGYGTSSFPGVRATCDSSTAGMSSVDTDCDDLDDTVNPGLIDNDCDGVDSDCDGSIDEDAGTCPSDSGDTGLSGDTGDSGDTGSFDTGDTGAPEPSCSGTDNDADGYCTDDGEFDCDDTDSSINPGATEIDNGATVDDDCDGLCLHGTSLVSCDGGSDTGGSDTGM